jgi:hypothetical protein
MSINNNVFAESRFWQCFPGENRLNFHRPFRRTRERLPSDGCHENHSGCCQRDGLAWILLYFFSLFAVFWALGRLASNWTSRTGDYAKARRALHRS